MAKATSDPLILDTVELPETDDLTCECWGGEPPEPCEKDGQHVFVYNGNVGGDGSENPKNCVACDEHVPGYTDEVNGR